jgi:PPOX class probable F420-dependent enzyme
MTNHDPGAPLPARIRAFLAAPRYATIATSDPDGAPRVATIWFRVTDMGLVVNSVEGRRWPANLKRDPRVSIAVHNPTHDGFFWVGLSGLAEVDEDRERGVAEISEMARRYLAHDPERAERLIAERYSQRVRVTFDIRVTEFHDHLDG